MKELASILVLAMLLAWETAAPFFHHFCSIDARARHGLKNLALGFINAFVFSSAIAFFSARLITFGDHHRTGLFNWVSVSSWLQTLITLVCFDLGLYFWHRANHRLPFLWKFHRTHHSDMLMDVTSAFRFHFGEIALSGFVRFGLILALTPRLKDVLIYETLLFGIVQFHHSNISLGGFDRPLAFLIVTPDIHRVHHSRARMETDSNYSSLLSVWDRLFQTRVTREDQGAIRLGLDEFSAPRHQTFKGMLATPLRQPGEKS